MAAELKCFVDSNNKRNFLKTTAFLAAIWHTILRLIGYFRS
jgi:hypothetical protein